MPRATGPIGYIEHRSPRKDENGKYIIHPQFVQKEMYDAEKMAHDSQGRCVDIPYRRTSTSPYVVHPYLLWILFLSF